MTVMTSPVAKAGQDKPPSGQEVSIWLDSYDEMFSDFDPRPYSKRTVSDDFIAQARNVSRDRSEKVSALKLLLPDGGLRDDQAEGLIAGRLHTYFTTNYQRLLDEKKKTIRRGLVLTSSGAALLVAASYLSFIKSTAYLIHLLVTLSEPAGWFMLWIGLDLLTFYQGRFKKELHFFSKMAGARIEFSEY